MNFIKNTKTKNRFSLGHLLLTRGVNDLVAESLESSKFVIDSVRRHAAGDWGDLDVEDKSRNDQALLDGSRIFSAYESQNKPRIWIITEADRSSTTVLFPDEY